ncbi:hypothetical protein ACLOJK_038595, partial [Asimina triloba]
MSHHQCCPSNLHLDPSRPNPSASSHDTAKLQCPSQIPRQQQQIHTRASEPISTPTTIQTAPPFAQASSTCSVCNRGNKQNPSHQRPSAARPSIPQAEHDPVASPIAIDQAAVSIAARPIHLINGPDSNLVVAAPCDAHLHPRSTISMPEIQQDPTPSLATHDHHGRSLDLRGDTIQQGESGRDEGSSDAKLQECRSYGRSSGP